MFAEVRREETRRKVMSSPVQNSSTETVVQGSALATKRNEGYNKKGTLGKDKRMWCEHCDKPNHTKDMCWDIHRKLPDWKPRSQRRNNAFVAEITNGAASQPFAAEQMKIL